MEQDSFTIGRLARHAKVGVETIRYYQNFGLIQEPPKPNTGYRQYPKATLERLHSIKRAQELGFSLKEIRRLLALGDNTPESRAMAADKLFAVRSKITHLVAIRAVLEDMIQQCDANPGTGSSPVLSALSSINLTA
jgi:MerR family mercuric resistance operon transcriptional regulator